MSKQFLTDPDNPRARKQEKGNMDFALRLEAAWIALGIPFYYARLATIDHKDLWIPCWKDKMTADETATFLFDDIIASYNLEKQVA
jgi:hypothetical protein